ncbi:hypothetical protein B7C42_08090 [Nocardia cerradoensis]|uniref:Uncharacterized protein n=1 Tax=Nocardia cerradoensis TaxID=85688 RepID=A0A231GT99_9NOCA|nr:hypothetical protein B7C42_08090 [Nocardia cerradoensis]
MPVPEGTGTTQHHPTREAPERADTTSFLAGAGHTIDYDRYAVPDHHHLPCLACGLERARNDTQPDHYDDGLCTTCREDNQPGIADHTPGDHTTARCTFITNHHPPAAALALLRKDWRHTRNPVERATIETFADTLVAADTPHNTSSALEIDFGGGFDPFNPTHTLTDTELTQAIGTLERRIQLADNEAIMYGPAPGITNTPSTVDTEWLEQELTELHAELTRRSGLTVEQAGTEQTRRASHAHDTEKWSTSEQRSLGTRAAEADGPQL